MEAPKKHTLASLPLELKYRIAAMVHAADEAYQHRVDTPIGRHLRMGEQLDPTNFTWGRGLRMLSEVSREWHKVASPLVFRVSTRLDGVDPALELRLTASFPSDRIDYWHGRSHLSLLCSIKGRTSHSPSHLRPGYYRGGARAPLQNLALFPLFSRLKVDVNAMLLLFGEGLLGHLSGDGTSSLKGEDALRLDAFARAAQRVDVLELTGFWSTALCADFLALFPFLRRLALTCWTEVGTLARLVNRLASLKGLEELSLDVDADGASIEVDWSVEYASESSLRRLKLSTDHFTGWDVSFVRHFDGIEHLELKFTSFQGQTEPSHNDKGPPVDFSLIPFQQLSSLALSCSTEAANVILKLPQLQKPNPIPSNIPSLQLLSLQHLSLHCDSYVAYVELVRIMGLPQLRYFSHTTYEGEKGLDYLAFLMMRTMAIRNFVEISPTTVFCDPWLFKTSDKTEPLGRKRALDGAFVQAQRLAARAQSLIQRMREMNDLEGLEELGKVLLPLASRMAKEAD